ncbi:hypothetical protein Hypma_009760 [Hypsizygus marmoreus]|uniref:Uncharacterized protein n=1 Tax=Hypsizygus marmoreus TaxID=39966 RepID=A0A369JRM5_HYPMA|nr:hypothetical protein Hypma_009760 [Hypsizygus marmoreus]
MTRLPFSLLALSERLGGVVEAIQTSFTAQSDKSPDYDALLAAELAAWRARRPQFRQIESYTARPSTYSQDEGSSYDTDGSETLVSEESHPTFYAIPELHKEPSAIVLSGKILPNIANFDEEDADTSDNESFYSFRSTRAEPDLERTAATTDGHINHLAASFSSPLVDCVTPLAPAPLHHSGKTRSKVVFIPRESLGTCPVHGCAPCGICQPTAMPVLFNFDL